MIMRGRRTPLAVDPTGIAVDIVFLFPDRNPVLDLIDDIPTCLERFTTMRRADTNNDGYIADPEGSESMDTI